jgi:hypothetical protein
LDLPAPIEKASEDKMSTFFHLVFSVEPKTRGKEAEDWKERAKESVVSYVRNKCEEGVLVQAVHDDVLRLEIAFRFSGEKRQGRFVREKYMY